MKVGYARVSTQDQNLQAQIDALINAGVDKRAIYAEKITGTRKNRPQLDKLIDELQSGDTVVILDITRLSRSTSDLFQIINAIKEKGATVKSVRDTWLDTTDDNPYGNFLLSVMGGLAQLERDLIATRTKEGLEVARRMGRKGGRPNKTNELNDLVYTLYTQNYTIKDIQKHTGLSRTSIYRCINSKKSELIE